MKYSLLFLVTFFILGIAIFGMGPRPAIDPQIRFDPATLPENLDKYLAHHESGVVDLIPGAHKEIIWAKEHGQKTPVAVVYIHGFSATKYETRPYPDKIAQAFAANLYYTRLAGHGQSGKSLAEVSMNDWIQDVAEAVAIGDRLGDKVILIGTSAGGMIATWAAANPKFSNQIDGLILMSPAYAIQSLSIGMLNMPWGESLLPLIMGQSRKWEPTNEQHGKWWTTTYPSRAIFPLAALMRHVDSLDFKTIKVPTLFIYSNKDKVIDTGKVKTNIGQWGSRPEVIVVNNSDDPSHHVIAGDILSPSTTDELVEKSVQWLKSGPLKQPE